ncbi:MAG: transglutaminase domain-containing protein [Candidatus Calescibacterium sp.]|nr:transglutaminase domain-containing protein [Candidatus Calescibacterium sp.]
MQQVENNVLFRFFSYLLCLLSIWGYGIFIYLSLFEAEFIQKSVLYSFVLTFGYFWSWKNRYNDQYFVKIILALLMIGVAIYFFRNLSESIYDPRIPLLELLISLLLIHSFDLPKRRDILYSITSTLIIVIVLTVVSFSNWIVLFIVIFTFLFLITLLVMDGEAEFKDLKLISRVGSGLIVFVVLLSAFLFVFLPKPSGGYFFRFVFAPKGDMANLGPSDSPEVVQKKVESIFSQTHTYRGFRGQMDLSSRGLLPHVLVMKVKSPFMTYIKGMHLMYYDGKKWYNSDDDDITITSTDYSYFSLPNEFEYYNYNVINSYFMVVEDLPDILYHIPVASEVFFPANFLRMRNYNLYAEYPLVKGITYTAVSKVPYFDMNKLKEFSYDEYKRFIGKIVEKNNFYYNYLSLPEMPIEIERISLGLTENEFTFWGKVEKIKEYLENNYTYDLFIDVPKTDAVYDFLFVQKRGYCEQFASSLAVMLRQVNIPARVVLGYAPQKKDPLTGFIEVYSDDAHSWVEVLTPFGWIPVDPTPYNIDEQTFKYLEDKNRGSNIYRMFGLNEEFIQGLSMLLSLTFRISVLLIFIFVVYNLYFVLRRIFIINYLEKIDISKIDDRDLFRVFKMFIEYFKMKGNEFPNEFTLREIKNVSIDDVLFQKFKNFIDIYERYIYGPK